MRCDVPVFGSQLKVNVPPLTVADPVGVVTVSHGVEVEAVHVIVP
jgi:hypothetical protein